MRNTKNDSKSVVCSYCHTRGHNRQTCIQLRADIARVEEKHGPDHPLVAEYKSNRVAVSKSASARAKMPRSCTYCHTLGHNRRTCETLKTDKQTAIERNSVWRKDYYMNIENHGLGIGAMLKMEDRTRKPSLWMVLRHEWQDINYITEGERGILIQQISNVGRRIWLSVSPMLVAPSLTLTGWEVVSPSYDFGVPGKWFTGELGIETLFTNHDRVSRVI